METAAEIAPGCRTPSEIERDRDEASGKREGSQEGGTGLGTAGIILSVLSFFFVPFLLGSAGIVLGVISWSERQYPGMVGCRSRSGFSDPDGLHCTNRRLLTPRLPFIGKPFFLDQNPFVPHAPGDPFLSIQFQQGDQVFPGETEHSLACGMVRLPSRRIVFAASSTARRRLPGALTTSLSGERDPSRTRKPWISSPEFGGDFGFLEQGHPIRWEYNLPFAFGSPLDLPLVSTDQGGLGAK